MSIDPVPPSPPWDEEEKARQKSIHNERVKLVATYLNGLAIAVAAIGGLTPVFSNNAFIGIGAQGSLSKLLGIALCLGSSVGLHVMARNLLGRLQ